MLIIGKTSKNRYKIGEFVSSPNGRFYIKTIRKGMKRYIARGRYDGKKTDDFLIIGSNEDVEIYLCGL